MGGVARIDHSNIFLLGGLIVLASSSALYLTPKTATYLTPKNTRPQPSPSRSVRATASPTPEFLLSPDPDVEIAVSTSQGFYEFSLTRDIHTGEYTTLLATGVDRDKPVSQTGKLDAATGTMVKNELSQLRTTAGMISESILSRKAKYSIRIHQKLSESRSLGCQFSDLDLRELDGKGCRYVVRELPNTYVGKLFASKGMVLPTADPAAAETPRAKR